jgi:nicotinate-nucleotide pyrophosphorylase (carboxylating)
MIDEMDADIQLECFIEDGASFERKAKLATLSGSTRDLLTCERTILNFLGRLCGIATQAREYCRRVEGTRARLYDTRKTTPGWRRLEKYATRCGGARNHRSGLHDAILIKDNHLACRASATGALLEPAEAVREARRFLAAEPFPGVQNAIIEIEIDRISQLESALSEGPDIVLLDNLSIEQLTECVQIRDRLRPGVELEASGGVNLETIGAIASTGVDRISVGALTHSAINLDLGLDWVL